MSQLIDITLIQYNYKISTDDQTFFSMREVKDLNGYRRICKCDRE